MKEKPEIVHIIRDGEAVTDCCKKTPFELSHADRIVVEDPKKQHQVNCPEYGWKNAVKDKNA